MPFNVLNPNNRAGAQFYALLAVTALSLSACSTNTAAHTSPASAAKDTTLSYATGDAEPTCLDPHVGGNYPQALISTQFMEPLVGRDKNGNIAPWLAAEWSSSADGKTLSFTLKAGKKFTDGTPLNSAAIKANIAHLQDPATGSSTGYLAVQKIQSVTIEDDLHFTLHLSAPDSALLESLSQQWTAIESPTAIARGLEANCQSPVGTGPYKIVQWVPQDRITLVRNDDYSTPGPENDHGGPAHIKNLHWRFIPDAATRYAALKSGEVQIIDNPLPADIAQSRNNKQYQDIDAPRPGAVNRLELNTAQTPFNDSRVREAFIRSANPAPGIKALFLDTAKPSYSLLASTESASISDKSLFKTNTAKAKRLLDAAGWKVGAKGVRYKDGKALTVRLPISTNQSTAAEQSLFEQIQANTAKVGFELKLSPMDLGSWYKALGQNEYELVSAPYTKVGPGVLRILYHTDGTIPAPSGYFANHAELTDPAIDTLLDRAQAASSASERKQLYAAAQKLILQSYAVLPLYDQQNHFLVNNATGVTTLHTVATPTFVNAKLPN